MKTSKKDGKSNVSSPTASRKKASRRKAKKPATAISGQGSGKGKMVASTLPVQENSFAGLRKSSPSPIPKWRRGPQKYLKWLLPDTEKLLCIGTSDWKFETKPLAEFSAPLTAFSYVVPAYMRHVWGKCKNLSPEGTTRWGRRTNANTERVRFVVYQSFSLSLIEQIEAVKVLRAVAPLVVVTKTGGQLIEAWFSTTGMSNDQIQHLRRFAAAKGAEKSVFINSHPYELPGGFNKKGRKIEVVFWNPVEI